MYRGLLFLCGFWALLCSCNVFEDDLEQQNLLIEFSARDGWGAFNQALRFSEDGVVTLTSTYPELTYQLSDEEFHRLKVLFHRYQTWDYEPRYYCADNVYLTINITEGNNFTHLNIDTCIFTVEKEWSELIQKFDLIFQFMQEIYEDVYSTQSPWLDLQVEYSLNKATYNTGEELVASYQIHNPTSTDRELWFQKGYPIYFSTQKRIDEAHLNFRYPINYRQIEDDPLMISLQSGETKTFSYTWNQEFPSGDSTISAIPGNYVIYTSFLSAELPGDRTTIEIVANE